MTLTEIFKKGIAGGPGNSILFKLNQIGTVTETLGCTGITCLAGRSARFACGRP